MFRAEGWQLVRNDAEAFVDGIRKGKLGQKGADAFADGCVQRLADLAEQELIANHGVAHSQGGDQVPRPEHHVAVYPQPQHQSRAVAERGSEMGGAGISGLHQQAS